MTTTVTKLPGKIARVVRFDTLLKDIEADEWVTPAFVALDREGAILSISTKPPENGPGTPPRTETVAGMALPGFVNAHSHSFQYAMAGMTECLAPGDPSDSFWSWRERMYQLALQLTPGEIKTIATVVFREMVRQGFTSVVEFHYLLNRPDGKPYTNPIEIAVAVAEAAKDAGIDLMLAPVYYSQSDFGKDPLPEQRRFLSKTVSSYLKQYSQLSKYMTVHGYRTAVTVHSLRAAKPEDLMEVFQSDPKAVKHMHIAEQRQEVDGAVAFLKKRPVEWMLENLALDHTYNFTHATHLRSSECENLAKQGVNVILCPSTEGNLGDGFFPLEDFASYGGRFTIGTDSHVSLSPFEELRWLEYGQRNLSQKRNVLLRTHEEDSGRRLAACAIHTGRSAAGLVDKPFTVGQSFDAIVLDPKHHTIWELPTTHLWSSLIFGHGSQAMTGTMLRGQWAYRKDHESDDRLQFSEWKKLATKIRGLELALPKKKQAAVGSSRQKT